MNLNHKGLTLIELLIAMVVSLIAMGLAYTTYSAQQRAYTNEQLVLDMQQNARSALAFMRREIRMAGYNPCAHKPDPSYVCAHYVLSPPSVQGFSEARGDRIKFTFDLDNDGDDGQDNETVSYRFKDENDSSPKDGIADTGVADLFRCPLNYPAGCSVLAFDIHAVAFAYAFDNDGDGQLDTFPDAPDVVIWAYDSNGGGSLDKYLDTNKDGVIDASDTPGGAALAPTIPMASTRAVQMWVLARTRYPIRGYTETGTYVVGPNHLSPGDGFKRSLVTGIAMVRNPGS